MRKILFAALAAMVMFASCDKNENDGIDPNGSKTVKVQITQAPTTLAVSDEVPDQYGAILNGGVFVFSDGTSILKTVNMPGDISVSQATIGHEIANVPNTVTRVHFFGNVPTGVTIPTSGTLASAKALMIDVASQADDADKVDMVSLFGETTSNISDTNGDQVLDAIFDITPISARVEIAKLTAGGAITGYKIEGIFINNYYDGQTVAGTKGTGVVVNNGSDVTKYTGPAYTTASAAVLHDWWTDPTSLGTTSDNKIYIPGTSKVWAYNVLAPSDAASDKSEVPHIVIRLSSITTLNGDPDFTGTTQYLTIKGYTGVDKFQGGYSYLLEDIAFDETNLKPQPEIEPISVKVKISIIPWTQVKVTPEFN